MSKSIDANAAAEVLKAVSDPTRVRILLHLAQSRANVTELCEVLDSTSQPAISHHLTLLRLGRVVEAEREGKNRYYRLTATGESLVEVIKTVAA